MLYFSSAKKTRIRIRNTEYVVFALDCVGEGVWTAEGEGEYSYIMSSLL